MSQRLWTVLYLFLSLLITATSATAQSDVDALSLLKQSKHFAMIRHALAPGFSDPSNFSVDSCSTQRNLDDQGRDQARDIGEIFKQSGLSQVSLFSSQWCRCIDTASLMDVGEVNPQPLLNSFFADRSRAEDQTRELKDWIVQHEYKQPLVLVTHQVNISALTGAFAASGEIIVAKINNDNEIVVVGSTKTR